MAEITLITGSTLGSAEYVAEHLASLLDADGFTTQTLHGPELEALNQSGYWLVVTSTHGAGDLPDNLQPLFDAIEAGKPDLSGIQFGAIGIGSREYDTFCEAIDKLSSLLQACGARTLGEPLKINILDHEIPEDPAEEWLLSWKNLLPIV